MIVPKRSSLPQFPDRLALHREKIVAWPQIEPLSLEKRLCRTALGSTKEKRPLQPFQGYSTHLSFVPSQPRETKNSSVLCLVGLSLVELSAPFWILPSLRLFLWPEGDKRNTFQIVKTSVQEGSCHRAKTNEKARPPISPSGSGAAEGETPGSSWQRPQRAGRTAQRIKAWTLGSEEALPGQLLHPQFGQLLLPFVPCQFSSLAPLSQCLSPFPFSLLVIFHRLLKTLDSSHLPSTSSPSSIVCPHLHIVAMITITAISYRECIMCF